MGERRRPLGQSHTVPSTTPLQQIPPSDQPTHSVRTHFEASHASSEVQKSRRRTIGVAIVCLAVIAFVWSARSQVTDFVRALRSASPALLLLAAATALTGVAVGYARQHQAAIGAFGPTVDDSSAMRLGLRAFSLNTTVKSGGLAGIGPYLRYADQTGQSRSLVRAGYLAANVIGDIAVAVVVAPTLVYLAFTGRMSTPIVIATVVFVGYLALVGTTVVTAARSRDALRRLHALPVRIANAVRRVAHRPVQPLDVHDAAADEMAEAFATIRRRPALILPSLGWALLVDVLGIATVALVSRAFGLALAPSAVVSAYCVALLFTLVGVLPGGLGFAEVSLASLLISNGVAPARAAAVTVAIRGIETWLPVLLGFVVRVQRPRNTRVRTRSGGVTSRRAASSITAVYAAALLWFAAAHRPVVDMGLALVDPKSAPMRGSRFLILLAALLLGATVRGLSRGSRFAHRTAIATVAVTSVLLVGRRDLVGLLSAVPVLVVLMVWRRSFRSDSDSSSRSQSLSWFAAGMGTVFVYGGIGLWALDTEVGEAMSWWRSIDTAARLLFILPTTTLNPASRYSSWFVDSVRFLALGVVVTTALRLLRPVLRIDRPSTTDRLSVRTLMQQHATTALAHFQLLGDKSFVFSKDREAFVGYRRVGTVAVALGEPIGATESELDAARQFLDTCDHNGWTPAFHQLTEHGADVVARCGLNLLKVGEEAIIDLRTFTLEGSHFKRLRSQLRKLHSDGIRFEPIPAPLDDATLDSLERISKDWLADGGHRERTFTLGHFDRDQLRQTPVIVARSPERIEAFVNIIPTYRSRDASFDLMRRRPDAPNGVMDGLFVALIERFRADGFDGMNLGLAPLANIDGDGLGPATLRRMARHDSRLFHFDGLRAFKEKWRPRWEPRYLAYPGDIALPRVGYAVSRVGELRATAPLLLRIGLPADAQSDYDAASAAAAHVVYMDQAQPDPARQST